MKSKLLSLSIALASIVSTVGCRPEVYPYCYGVNEKNMPPKVVIVESFRDAERYEWNAKDTRLMWDNLVAGDGSLIALDGLTLNYASCKNIDGFEDIAALKITGVDRSMSSAGDKGWTRCTGLSFDASSDTNDIALERLWNPPGYWDTFNSMSSTIVNTPAIFDGEGIWSGSAVSISPTYAGRNMDDGKTPLREEELYAQDTENNSPPLIITRVWYFDNIPEMAEAKAYLGIESDDEILACGDVYFGYFSR